MKRIKNMLMLLALCMVMLLPEKAYAAEAKGRPENMPVLMKNNRYCWYENGERIKSQWRTYDGEKYYFAESGYASISSVRIDGVAYVFDKNAHLMHPEKARFYKCPANGRTYYVDTKGRGKTGWFHIGSRLYYGDPKGRLYTDQARDGVTFKKDCSAVVNTASRLKIKVMDLVAQITNSKMSQSQKLKACWNYLTTGGRFRYRSMSPNIYRSGWQKEFAYSMLVSHSGSCSSFAAAFAALAAEIGYEPYIVYGRVPGSRDGAADGMTRHAWVRINGCHYDPEGYFAGWAGYIYGYGYYPIYHTVTKIMNFKTY